MKNILNKDHGTIITGSDTTNKMAFANLIAGSLGTVAVADFQGITGLYNSVFLTNPDVLIVTQFNPTHENLTVAKSLVANDKMIVERKGYDPETVALPLFIFVTNGAQVVKQAEASRRFTVIRIEG